MDYLDLAALARTPLSRAPFEHIVVPGLVDGPALAAVLRDFPVIEHPGLVPPSQARCGPALEGLLGEIAAGGLSRALSDKFGLDLAGQPLLTLLRGRCSARDGRIHTDSETKLVTALLYLNETWEAPGGRLRLLNGPDDLDDYAAEVAPRAGTLVAFRRSARSFHGHAPFVGERRYLLLTWMSSVAVAKRELLRHVVSARAKRWLGAAGARV